MTNLSAILPRITSTMLPAIVVLVLLTPINGQVRQPPSGAARPSPTGGSVPEAARQPGVRERQWKILEMEREVARVRTPEEEKLALAQIAEDFEKIQVVNNKMMAVTMRAATPDYARIAETTAEIRTRASRMKENLRLAKVDAKNENDPPYKKAEDAAGLKANLLSFDKLIMSFVKNPIFTNPGVVDVSHSASATRDLEAILQMAPLINKDARKLAKPSAKNP